MSTLRGHSEVVAPDRKQFAPNQVNAARFVGGRLRLALVVVGIERVAG